MQFPRWTNRGPEDIGSTQIMALPAGLTRRGRIYYSKFKDPKTSAWRRQSVGPDLVLALQRHAELRGLSEETEPGPSFKELVEPWLQAQETRCKPRTVQVSRQRIQRTSDAVRRPVHPGDHPAGH